MCVLASRCPSAWLVLHLSLAALLGVTSHAQEPGAVVINEIVAINRDGLRDAQGGTPDWIELRNQTSSTVSLENWHLTDDPATPNKWAFPAISLEPSQFLIIYASGEDVFREQEWHANLKLSGDGETIVLTNAQGETVDTLDYPPQLTDHAYGLDDSTNYRFWSTPTPGTTNSDPPDAPPLLVPEPIENPPVQDEDFIVRVRVQETTAPVNEVIVRHRVLYKSEARQAMRDDGVSPDETADDGIYAAVLSSQTLFGSRWKPGEMVRWRFEASDSQNHVGTLPLVSSGRDGAEYFGSVIHDPELSSDLPILHWFTNDPESAVTPTGARASAYFEGVFYDNFFVRRRGQFGAIGWEKPKLKFDFNPGEHFRYDPERRLVEEFNLQSHFVDPSAMRENAAFQFFNDIGTPAPLTQHWHVRLNAEYHGLFSFVEQVDEDFLIQQGLDPNGAMYKANGFPSTLAKTVTPALYQKETRKEEPYDDLRALTAGLGNGSKVDRAYYVLDHVNLPAMVNEMAGQSIIRNADRLTKNYYVYRDPQTDLWQRIPWDMDGAFSTSTTLDSENYASPLYGDRNHTQAPNQSIYQNYLLAAILDYPTTREMYLRRLRTLVDNYLSASAGYFEERLRQFLAHIEDEAQTDSAKWARGNARAGVDTIINTMLPKRRRQLLETYGPSGQGLVPEAQTPGLKIEIGEIDFLPEGDRDSEYIELINPNKEAIDLTDWTVKGAVDFVMPPGTVIPAKGNILQRDRGKLYLVKSVRAFRDRTTGPRGGRGLFFIGEYRGRLSSDGETIRVFDDAGLLVAEETYEGFDPQAALAEALGGHTPRVEMRDGALHLRFHKSITGDYEFFVQQSDDLETWIPILPDHEEAMEEHDGFSLTEMRFPAETDGYLRLRIRR